MCDFHGRFLINILCQVKEVACYYKFTEERKLCSHAGFEDEESGSEPRNIGYFWKLEKSGTDFTRGFFSYVDVVVSKVCCTVLSCSVVSNFL